MKIYIIQQIIKGISECPDLFIDEKKADKFYIDLVNEEFNKNFKTIEETSDFLREKCDYSLDLHYWVNKRII